MNIFTGTIVPAIIVGNPSGTPGLVLDDVVIIVASVHTSGEVLQLIIVLVVYWVTFSNT